MNDKNTWMLAEREKELECMYAVDDVLQDKTLPLPVAMSKIIQIIPTGFSRPEICFAMIKLYDVEFASPDFAYSQFLVKTPIYLDDIPVGSLEVRYLADKNKEIPQLLKTEVKIIEAVASRISQLALNSQREINLILDMLQKVNPNILTKVCQKLQVYVNNLEGEAINTPQTVLTYGEVNTPMPKSSVPDELEYGRKLVSRATAFLSNVQIREMINQWIQDERMFSLVKTVGNRDAQVTDILDAVQSYTRIATNSATRSSTEKWLIAELTHRFLTSDETLIDRIVDNLSIEDFEPLISRIVVSSKANGSIGGKGAGLFIADQILKHAATEHPILKGIKTPQTWYIAADQIDEFLSYNHMEEMNAYKYNPISYVRMTYDDVVANIKNGRLPSHILRLLSVLLDDLKETPIIVRSSSLLEDRSNSAFSGKYKSLYLANQGSKQERLDALIDAILEVYSSQYNPDSLQYREQRHLLHFSEKMGVLIQEVVGTKIGPYYMPLFAGVAFSENPLCWSPRISREEGLVRMVMGLGTRAVDRVNDDYPLLFSPQNPNFKINQNPDDIKHYSPKYIDLMNLETGDFETVEAVKFLKEWGTKVPQLHRLVSVYHPEIIQKKNFMDLSTKKDDLVITFDGVLSDTDFPAKMKCMLEVLKKKMGVQVDLEFAYDGENLVLLQCRTLNKGMHNEAAPIPKNLPKNDILFTANRFISNGRLENIQYIVYVDGDGYRNLKKMSDLLAVGKVVGLLNNQLPRRKYILMGPGRWGSRGDIQLGVRVTYSDISNTSLLIEIARQQQSYVPELSFGTHFFQDLVESSIGYLPLYPDEKDNIFKERFFTGQTNRLEKFLPQYKFLSDVVYVIDLAEYHSGKSLSVHMNADLNQAVAFLSEISSDDNNSDIKNRFADKPQWKESGNDQHWRWRKYMAEQIAKEMDFDYFGVKGVYLFGSTDEETAGIGSDIDLLIYFYGDDIQRKNLKQWLDGWSLALAKINYLRTGSSCSDGLLDVHIVTDEDIKRKDSYAIKIHSIVEPATSLREKSSNN